MDSRVVQHLFLHFSNRVLTLPRELCCLSSILSELDITLEAGRVAPGDNYTAPILHHSRVGFVIVLTFLLSLTQLIVLLAGILFALMY